MAGPAANIGSNHVCLMCSGFTPHTGGPVTQGEHTVLIGGKPASTIGSVCTCAGPPDTIVTGISNVLIEGKPAATVGSMTAHGGTVVTGEGTVLIGTGTSAPKAVMPIKEIPFIKITYFNKVKAFIVGLYKNLRQSETNQQKIKELAENQPPQLILTKVAFSTKYDVCSDDVSKFDEKKKFYILEDKNEYYHWLKDRKPGTDNDIKVKPKNIPITFPSTAEIKLKATFKLTTTNLFTKSPRMRVTDKNNKYIFKVEKGEKKEEFDVTFKSDNIPYEETIQYIDKFELHFEYSEDRINWKSAGSSINTLYLTWKEPMVSSFIKRPADELYNMEITASFNEDKINIPETLLSIGCKQANGLGSTKDSSEKILDAIFKEFENKHINRTREGDVNKYLDKDLSCIGLGYWRGASASSPKKDKEFKKKRGLRELLRNGEGRCLEFNELFFSIALLQTIKVYNFSIYTANHLNRVLGILSKKYVNSVFLVKPWGINDPYAPTEIPITGNKGQGNRNPSHSFSDHVFSTFHDDDKKKKYYDPSYGVKGDKFFSSSKELLKAYSSKWLTGVVFAKKSSKGYYFYDALHSGDNIDLLLGKRDPKEVGLYLYQTKKTNMDKYLAYVIMDSTKKSLIEENKNIIKEL